VIPQTAVRPSERGFVSFVVVDEKAQERILKLGMRTADGQVEVLSGLQPGEQLVVRGAEALRNGVTVRLGKEPEATVRPYR
jgi:multidrug efflux system membrane fusion protein